MRGRKPAPTALKILRQQRADQVNFNEPKLKDAAAQDPPAWLGRYGCELWRKLFTVLLDAGLMTVGDVPGFEQLCDEYDTIRRDPLDGDARDRFRRLLVEFGLTPSSRSRLRSTKAGPVDKMAEFLQAKVKA